MIRVYTIGGRRLMVLPHTPESDVRDEAVSLAREEGIETVLVLDRAPSGDETVVESIALAPQPPGEAGPAVAEAQRIARDAATDRRAAGL